MTRTLTFVRGLEQVKEKTSGLSRQLEGAQKEQLPVQKEINKLTSELEVAKTEVQMSKLGF